jgi:hypothetical protein
MDKVPLPRIAPGFNPNRWWNWRLTSPARRGSSKSSQAQTSLVPALEWGWSALDCLRRSREGTIMAISEESRHHLYCRLDAVLGPEEAATLMEHLPPVGWDAGARGIPTSGVRARPASFERPVRHRCHYRVFCSSGRHLGCDRRHKALSLVLAGRPGLRFTARTTSCHLETRRRPARPGPFGRHPYAPRCGARRRGGPCCSP